MNLSKRLLKDTIIYGSGRYVQQFIGFLLIPLYTRFLLPGDYGILDTITTFHSALGIMFVLGLDSAFARFFVDTTDENEKKIISSTVFFFRFVIILFFSLIIFFLSSQLSLIFYDSQSYKVIFEILSITFVFNFIYIFSLEALRFTFQPRIYAIITVAFTVIDITTTILFVVYLKLGVVGIFYAKLIAVLFCGAPFSFYRIRKFIIPRFSFGYLVDLLKYGLPLVPAAVSYWILTSSDRYFLLKYSTIDQIGLYSIGEKFSKILEILISGFQLAWAPFVISIYKESYANDIFKKVFKYYTAITCLLALIVSIFGLEIVQLMTQPSYYSAYLVIPFIIFSPVAQGTYYIVAIGTNIKKKTKNIAWTTGIAAVSNIILNFLLIPNFGIIGAAFATTVSFIISAVILYLYSQKIYYIPHDIKSIILIFAVTLLFIVLGLLTNNLQFSIRIYLKILLIVSMTSFLVYTKLVDIQNIKIIVKNLFVKNK